MTTTMKTTPDLTVGVGVFVRKRDKILLGRRGPASRRGAGCLALPGGRQEPGEKIITLVKREVHEETGLFVNLLEGYDYFEVPGLLAVTDHNEDPVPRNHLSLWVLVTWAGGAAEVREPDKNLSWEWLTPAQVAELPGVCDPHSEVYYWTPIPLWRRILKPFFGTF